MAVNVHAYGEVSVLCSIGESGHGSFPPPCEESVCEFALEWWGPEGPLVLGEGIEWAEPGCYDFTADNTPDFVAFADGITDGDDDWMVKGHSTCHAFGRQVMAREFNFLGDCGDADYADLFGYQISFVRLCVTEVQIREEPPWIKYDCAATWEIWGLPEPATLSLDIKPGSCPNPLNCRSHGMLPVALLGTTTFDVSNIDPATVRLSRADGIGGSVVLHEGPPGPQWVFEDVATPFEGEPCECHELGGDGIADLSMKFRTDEVVDALQLDDSAPGASVELVVSGSLLDGMAFTASDCVTVQQPGGEMRMCDATSSSNRKGPASAASGVGNSPTTGDIDTGAESALPEDVLNVGCGALGPGVLLMTVAALSLVALRGHVGGPSL